MTAGEEILAKKEASGLSFIGATLAVGCNAHDAGKVDPNMAPNEFLFHRDGKTILRGTLNSVSKHAIAVSPRHPRGAK